MCDLVYATDSARFGATEINMGLLPGWGGTVRLARAMPIHRAREVVYSGRKDYTAHDMYEMGLLTRVWPDDRFEDAFTSTVEGIAAKKPIALRIGKEVMARSLETPGLDAALALERNAIQWLTSAPDMQASLTTPSGNRRHVVTEQRQAGATRLDSGGGLAVDFALSDEQRHIRDTFAGFCSRELQYEYVPGTAEVMVMSAPRFLAGQGDSHVCAW